MDRHSQSRSRRAFLRATTAFAVTAPIWSAAVPSPAAAPRRLEKMSLWRNAGGPRLRGAVVEQRRVYPDIDGDAMGPGPVGPVYRQDDFEHLARCGANLVVISHPGLFSEKPPYQLDRAIQANLDDMLRRIWKADMFAVIAQRTGPGRSEFTFYASEVGTWFGPDKLNDRVWGEAGAQDAWAAMWRTMAERYCSHPAVVGYELMVEPNSNAVGKDAIHDNPQIWDPAAFEKRYGGTLYDWNGFYPRIVKAIRAVDPHTPILVEPNAYGNIGFLSQLRTIDDPHTVYALHNYEPRKYTHQNADAHIAYPGEVDVDWDNKPDPMNKDYLVSLYEPAWAFQEKTGRDLAVTEMGAMRWAPGAAGYIDDETDLLEAHGAPYTVYEWAPLDWHPVRAATSFNIRLGPSPDNMNRAVDSPYLDAVKRRWAGNRLRPSMVRFPGTRG
jgi:hypothetical protein